MLRTVHSRQGMQRVDEVGSQVGKFTQVYRATLDDEPQRHPQHELLGQCIKTTHPKGERAEHWRCVVHGVVK